MTEHDQGFVIRFDVGNAGVPLVEAGYDATNQFAQDAPGTRFGEYWCKVLQTGEHSKSLMYMRFRA